MALSSPRCTDASSAASSCAEGGGEFTSPVSLYIKTHLSLKQIAQTSTIYRRSGNFARLKRHQCNFTRKWPNFRLILSSLPGPIRNHEKIEPALSMRQSAQNDQSHKRAPRKD